MGNPTPWPGESPKSDVCSARSPDRAVGRPADETGPNNPGLAIEPTTFPSTSVPSPAVRLPGFWIVVTALALLTVVLLGWDRNEFVGSRALAAPEADRSSSLASRLAASAGSSNQEPFWPSPGIYTFLDWSIVDLAQLPYV